MTFLLPLGTKELTLPVLCFSESCTKVKINLNVYFDTAMWCLKRFYEGLKGTTNECENKTFKLIFSLRPGSVREGLMADDYIAWC